LVVAGPAVILLHVLMSSYAVPVVIIPIVHQTSVSITRFDHPSVSVAAIKTNQLESTDHFLIDVYEYCHAAQLSIPIKDLNLFGSVGTLFIPAEIKFSLMPDNAPPVVGRFQLSIW
jgi:hypothetical protein